MKRCALLLGFLVLLTGCAPEETFETVGDELAAQVIAQQRQIYVELPEDAVSPVIESDAGQLYLCGDQEIGIQVLEGGDRERTVRELTGHDMEELTVMETLRSGIPCLEFVWACAGESGDMIGRAAVLDDGNYHYCLTVLAPAETAEQNQAVWERMFATFQLC